MSEPGTGSAPAGPAVPDVKKGRRLSPVWVVPVVAVLAAGWVAWKAMSERGPTVEISFQTAEGLEAGRTSVKHKDVQVGLVQSIRLDDELKSVIVSVELHSSMDRFVTDETRFWVVRPRVGAGGVSGLGTLFSGAYIALDPSADGRRTKEFKGLEEPPVVTQADPGTSYRLTSPGLGSLSIGAPVYFREIRVGEITQYSLEPGGKHVEVSAFVRAPYDQYVRTNTRFWNAGGINLNLGADGISLESASLVSILVGGIAFDTPTLLDAGDQAKADQVFPLYSSQRASEEEIYSTEKQYMLAYFDESVRGLSRSSPVELNGMKVGSVADVKLRFNEEALTFRASVLLEIYPDRIREILVGADEGDVKENRHLRELVQKGLRAQLKTGSLLTGARYVNVAIVPGVEQADLLKEGEYEVIPTVPSGGEDLARMLARLSEKIDEVPFDEIGKNINEAAAGVSEIVNSDELREAIASMSVTLAELRELTGQVNDEMAPAIAASVDNAERVLEDARRMLAPDSPVSVEIKRVLREMADAARSIRSMADYLEQHPEALIRGKARETD